MLKRIAAKLRGRGGETFAETLIALLISSLALVMLAAAISASSRIVTTSRTTLTAYYADENSLAMRAGSASATTITLSIRQTNVSGENAWNNGVSYVGASCYSNSGLGGNTVYAYSVPAVSAVSASTSVSP